MFAEISYNVLMQCMGCIGHPQDSSRIGSFQIILMDDCIDVAPIIRHHYHENPTDKNDSGHSLNKKTPQGQQFYIRMSNHSNKYYHLIKALRVQKHQSEISKVLRQNNTRTQTKQEQPLTPKDISNIIDLDNSAELNEKDSKYVVKLTDNDNSNGEFSRLWQQFQKMSMTMKITSESMPIQRKIAQNKDEKLIDYLLQSARREREERQAKLAQLTCQIREEEQQVTTLKEQAIEYGLQLEGFEKEFMELKTNFERQQKKINERSTKYKEEKSKDIMIINIDRDDMEMRKAMASRIKLNQELDFGFQLQRRRAFNQAKAAITEKKKTVQQKLAKLKNVINQNQAKQDRIIAEKAQLQAKNELLQQQQIYFCKQTVKKFKGHSRGIQWIIKLLQELGIKLGKEDLPDDMPKEDAAFIASLLREMRPKYNQNRHCETARPKTSFKKTFHQHFQTEPNLNIDEQRRNISSLERKRLENKTTVYFDIESQRDNQITRETTRQQKSTSFNINSKSLRKIYEHAGEVIGNMIKNHSINYNSCRIITPTAVSTQQSEVPLLQKSALQEKIKAKFMNVRQKERRNNLKRLLFGST